jgi:hypothetical protein
MYTELNEIVLYYRSVYTTTLYREIITLCHIISLCYTDYMFRTGPPLAYTPTASLSTPNYSHFRYYGIKTSLIKLKTQVVPAIPVILLRLLVHKTY